MTCYSRPIWPSSLSLGILPASEDHLPDERLLQLVHPPQLLLQLRHERVLGRDLSGASVSATVVLVDLTDIHFALKIVLVAADDGDEFLIGRSSAIINGRKWENSARGQAIFLANILVDHLVIALHSPAPSSSSILSSPSPGGDSSATSVLRFSTSTLRSLFSAITRSCMRREGRRITYISLEDAVVGQTETTARLNDIQS